MFTGPYSKQVIIVSKTQFKNSRDPGLCFQLQSIIESHKVQKDTDRIQEAKKKRQNNGRRKLWKNTP